MPWEAEARFGSIASHHVRGKWTLQKSSDDVIAEERHIVRTHLYSLSAFHREEWSLGRHQRPVSMKD